MYAGVKGGGHSGKSVGVPIKLLRFTSRIILSSSNTQSVKNGINVVLCVVSEGWAMNLISRFRIRLKLVMSCIAAVVIVLSAIYAGRRGMYSCDLRKCNRYFGSQDSLASYDTAKAASCVEPFVSAIGVSYLVRVMHGSTTRKAETAVLCLCIIEENMDYICLPSEEKNVCKKLIADSSFLSKVHLLAKHGSTPFVQEMSKFYLDHRASGSVLGSGKRNP